MLASPVVVPDCQQNTTFVLLIDSSSTRHADRYDPMQFKIDSFFEHVAREGDCEL
jgi:hypothetical protein